MLKWIIAEILAVASLFTHFGISSNIESVCMSSELVAKINYRTTLIVLGHKCHPQKLILCGLIHFSVVVKSRGGYIREDPQKLWKVWSAIRDKWIRKCHSIWAETRFFSLYVLFNLFWLFRLFFSRHNMLNITTPRDHCIRSRNAIYTTPKFSAYAVTKGNFSNFLLLNISQLSQMPRSVTSIFFSETV